MLRKLRKFNFLPLLLVFYSSSSCSIPVLSNPPGPTEEYLRLQQEYIGQFCPADLESKYQELLKDFRGEGYFVPVVENDNQEAHIDLNTLRLRLPLVQQKIVWLDGLLEKINKLESLPQYRPLTQKIEGQLAQLLELKKLYYHDPSKRRRRSYTLRSQKLYRALRQEFDVMIKKIPFLLSFNFPVDYFAMRKEYEHFKHQKDLLSQHKANAIFLKRKILEDGAYELDNTKPDNLLRANLDTLALRLHQDHDFIPEDIRYDLEYTLKQLERFLAFSKNNHHQRLIAWKIRAENEYAFYFKLLQDAQGSKKQQAETTALVKKRSHAKHILKDFVLKREAQAWKFWSEKPELMQALFVMDTILVNEVGTLDTDDALERKDVAQVVINRHNLRHYSQLTSRDSIWAHLKEQGVSAEKIGKHPWLNVLFKEGEFSFTYFFIPASVRIFCPDQTRMAKKLQQENLQISLKMLKSPNYAFRAVRYFSRASMVGRIDMAPMWMDHRPYPERPGMPLSSRTVGEALKRGEYKYFYTFTDPEEKEFDVVEVQGRSYVVSSQKALYHYRNPHLFRYFEKQGEEVAQTVLFEGL